MTSTEKGRDSEILVANYLDKNGWNIKARNWRKQTGELDIIASKNNILAFVEVKNVDAFGLESLTRSVGAQKQKKIIETSKLFIQAHREFSSMMCRYDVATVKNGSLTQYYENAFSE